MYKKKPLAVYIHWPYCQSKCPYCDFNSYASSSIDHAAFREAYRRELEHYARLLPDRRITSIFFGGGTPSLMQEETVAAILQNIARHWSVADDVEITLEANPTSAEAKKFAAFHQAGVNRLSLGIQSLRDETLTFLGRAHDADQAKKALDLAAQNFPRFSFDLIYALKGQTPEAWETELREALKMAQGHLSLYQLTIESGTHFYKLAERGETLTAPDEHAALMYERTHQILNEAGLPAYEISNHAKVGQESRHNLTYWHYEDYIGIGPGAHGRYRISDARTATDNHRAPEIWLKQVHEQGQGLRHSEPIDLDTAQREALMMGLRLTTGIAHKNWQEKFTTSLNDFLPPAKIQRLEQEGYLRHTAPSLQATASGLQRLNAVLHYLLN